MVGMTSIPRPVQGPWVFLSFREPARILEGGAYWVRLPSPPGHHGGQKGGMSMLGNLQRELISQALGLQRNICKDRLPDMT